MLGAFWRYRLGALIGLFTIRLLPSGKSKSLDKSHIRSDGHSGPERASLMAERRAKSMVACPIMQSRIPGNWYLGLQKLCPLDVHLVAAGRKEMHSVQNELSLFIRFLTSDSYRVLPGLAIFCSSSATNFTCNGPYVTSHCRRWGPATCT
jgi:hypothetical protein